MSIRDILPFRRHEDADETHYADLADIAAFDKARSEQERSRIVDSVRARARAARR
jgi:hypothetical protein